MAVPAHDNRDFEFASRYKLPVVKVILSIEESDERASATPERIVEIMNVLPEGAPYALD